MDIDLKVIYLVFITIRLTKQQEEVFQNKLNDFLFL